MSGKWSEFAASPIRPYNLMMQDSIDIVLNGRYQLIERIGSGGMSIVYKAQDRALGRIVAIKMLHEGMTSDEGFLRRFQQEAHSAANLTHPNVVTVHDIGNDRNRHYIVMEYVNGRTLKQIIRSHSKNGRFMSIDRVLNLTIQLCAGLGYAHRANLAHCDVKPQNILITRDDRVKIADFGIARAISEASQQYQDSQVWGTPQYFSPEQAAGSPATPASDVYAIGVILFEMLSGRLPFIAESQTALALKHLQEPPPSVTIYNPAVPRQLELIVDKLLSKEASARYRTAGQLGSILKAYYQSSLQDTGPLPLVTQQVSQPVAEQKTQIHQRPTVAPAEAITRPPATRSKAEDITQLYPKSEHRNGLDWTAIILSILALIALIGLIPLWYNVYLAYLG